ncbi:hypothetical protein O9K51_04559 [Purpureocillium lavendulum]|uniref:Uncharacterized protein n=1 Tax=Purpureocillium lavendulum TaxID=1247861 RepID=A0AB34FVM6_9HYPO|nr:hypothetical protein O9K51_04559 [Purpureocillium lavendulum]
MNGEAVFAGGAGAGERRRQECVVVVVVFRVGLPLVDVVGAQPRSKPHLTLGVPVRRSGPGQPVQASGPQHWMPLALEAPRHATTALEPTEHSRAVPMDADDSNQQPVLALAEPR